MCDFIINLTYISIKINKIMMQIIIVIKLHDSQEVNTTMFMNVCMDLTNLMRFSRARNFAAARKMKNTGLQRTYFW